MRLLFFLQLPEDNESFFKKKNYISHRTKKFSSKNKFSGSISSFLGKVRPHRNRKEIQFLEIEFYKKMAYYQAERNLKNFK